MRKETLEWSGDCPNDCGYCRKHHLECIYEVPQYECPVCHKKIFENEIYEYKGFECCYECLDVVKEKVGNLEKEANESTIARHVVIHPELWDYAKKDTFLSSAIERASKESAFDVQLRKGQKCTIQRGHTN